MKTHSKSSVECNPKDRINLNAETKQAEKQLVQFASQCMSIKEWMAAQKLDHKARDQTILKNTLIAEIHCEGSVLLARTSAQGGETMVFEAQLIRDGYRALAGKKMDKNHFQRECDRIAKCASLSTHPTATTMYDFLAHHNVALDGKAFKNAEEDCVYASPNMDPTRQYLIDIDTKKLVCEETVLDWSFWTAHLWSIVIGAEAK